MQSMSFAEFPIDEYEKRLSRSREIMNENGLDAILVTGKECVRYFAGGPLSALERDYRSDFFVLLPAARDNDPVLLGTYAFQGIARNSWLDDKRFWPFDPSGSMLMRNKKIDLVADAIREKKLADAKIGIERDSGLRISLTLTEWEYLQDALPGVKWQSSSAVVWGCRQYKSPREIEKLRAACEITCAAFEEGMRSMKPGMTEKDVAAVISKRAFEEGADERGFLSLIVGPPRGSWCEAPPADVPVERGSLLIMDGGCQVDGYCCDIARTVSVGPPSKQNQDLFALAYQAQRDVEGALEEGAVIGEMHAIGRRAFEDAGLASHMSSGGYGKLGHGVGLHIHEHPDLCRDSKERFAKGMVFAIEPTISDYADRGEATQLYVVENNFAITDRGVERLTPLDDQLFIA